MSRPERPQIRYICACAAELCKKFGNAAFFWAKAGDCPLRRRAKNRYNADIEWRSFGLSRERERNAMKTYHILFNPHAGNGRGEEEAHKLDTLLAGTLVYHNMTEIADYEDFLRTAPADEDLVLCGGDGTINRFLNDTAGVGIPNELLYFGIGSGNDFLHDLGMEKGAAPFPVKKYLENLPTVSRSRGAATASSTASATASTVTAARRATGSARRARSPSTIPALQSRGCCSTSTRRTPRSLSTV